VWDVEKKEVLCSKDLEAVPSAVAWHSGPKSNTLASIGEDGNIHLWTNVIPSHMLAPSAPVDEMALRLARSKDISEGTFVAAL
jgi:WD40 repeat protein